MAVEKRASVRPQGRGKAQTGARSPHETSPLPGATLEAGTGPLARETYVSRGAEGRRSQE